jgi:hypothetical protein
LRFLLTDDERRLLCGLLREHAGDPGTAESRVRLLRKLEGEDKRVAVETDAPAAPDDAVAQALQHGS